jgi:hypothetical protein
MCVNKYQQCHRRVHIMCEGREINIDKDEEGLTGKHTLGKASCGSLRHFASTCGADEVDIELFTSLGLRVTW